MTNLVVEDQSSWRSSISGAVSSGKDVVVEGTTFFAERLHPKVWGGLGVGASIGAANQFIKGNVVQGVEGLWAAAGCNIMSVMGGASKEEAAVTAHASTMAAGATFLVDGAQKISRAPQQEQGFISAATAELIAGGALVYGALNAGPEMTQYMTLLGTTALTSAVFVNYGMGQIGEGEYRKGLLYTAVGLFGIATSAYTAYQLMGVPENDLQDQFGVAQGFPTASDVSEKHPPFNPQKDFPKVPRRKGFLATVYNNNGNEEREKISDLVVGTHREYAEYNGIESIVISDAKATKGKCLDLQGKQVDCTPYFEKIAAALDFCKDPKMQGHVVGIIDDDAPITNMNREFFHQFEALRTLDDGRVVDAKLVLIQESGDWPSMFKIPRVPQGKHHPNTAVNTGFIFYEVGEGPCGFLEKAYENRHVLMDQYLPNGEKIDNFEKCPRIGVCNHGVTSLGDQTAIALEMQKGFEKHGDSYWEKVVRVVEPHKAEANRLWRGGCSSDVDANGQDIAVYNIDAHDRKPENKHGIWQPGDWFGQPAGFKVMGRYPLEWDRETGECIADPDKPVINKRLEKVREMLHHRVRRIQFHVGMTTDEDVDSRHTTVDIAARNHQLVAHMNNAKWFLDNDPNRLDKLRCVNPITKEERKAAAYWRKVAFADEFVKKHKGDVETDHVLVMLDGDALMQPKTDLYKLWKDTAGESGAVMLVAGENPLNGKLNTGFFMLKAGEEASKLTAKWQKRVNAPSYSPDDPQCPTLGCCDTQTGGLHEQTALEKLLEQDPNLPVTIIPVRGGAVEGVNTYKRDGVMQGTVKGWNDGIVKYPQDEIHPKHKAKRGDAVIQCAGVPRKGRLEGEQEKDGPLRRRYVMAVAKSLIEKPKYIRAMSEPGDSSR